MQNSELTQLAMTLECLRMTTLYAVAPTQGSLFADPTPVKFTLNNNEGKLSAKPLNDTISCENVTVASEISSPKISSLKHGVKVMRRQDVQEFDTKQE